ncbi:MAG TPA: endonuclease/exonuclease/phosphatase family protein, partial [Deltaproteobacteria bacterium]|nr:endonuclease/exonuclease/phosphatase family protein [Deltaproteobacteria bacterium]
MKLVSWNVNGIRAAMKYGFFDVVKKIDPDVLCLQETKASREQITVDLPGYLQFWNSADRRGYSG